VDTKQATSTIGRFSPDGAQVDVTRMKDLVCPECSSSISFASASMVASCTLCGADLDLSCAEPVEVELAPASEVRED
jgi:hypothetical protein